MKSQGALIAAPLIVAVVGLASMTLIAYSLQNGSVPLWSISEYNVVNLTFTTQMMVLPISFLALGWMYFHDRTSFRKYFRHGFGTAASEINWNVYGFAIAVAVTTGNIMLMSFGVLSQNGQVNNVFLGMLPLVLIFSATNAWSEEIFSRFVIVAGLDGKIDPSGISLISGIIFGIPHFLGTPSGVFGVIASGILGWLMAKLVIGTKGLGWALIIHFLQDVVIFGAGAMILAGQN